MNNPKKSFIFIVETDEGELFAGRQKDVDNAIKQTEKLNIDLDFKVIGKIAEPNGPFSLPIDFNESLIEWLDGESRDSIFIKRTVLAITNFII